jgi:DNA repair exonuclease SbcCD ATPase subunit
MFKKFMPAILALAIIASAHAENSVLENEGLNAVEALEALGSVADLTTEDIEIAATLGLPNPEDLSLEDSQALIDAITQVEKTLSPTEKAKAFLKKYKRAIAFTVLGAAVAGTFVVGAHKSWWPDFVMKNLPEWKWLIGKDGVTKRETARTEAERLAAEKAKTLEETKAKEELEAVKNDVARLEEDLKKYNDKSEEYAEISEKINAAKSKITNFEEAAAKKEELKKQQEEELKKQQEEELKKQQEEKAKLEAEEKAKLEAEEKAKLEAEEKAKLEAEAKAKKEAEEAKAKKEDEEKKDE